MISFLIYINVNILLTLYISLLQQLFFFREKMSLISKFILYLNKFIVKIFNARDKGLKINVKKSMKFLSFPNKK